MATILVDYENVVFVNGLSGVQYLTPDDTLCIFYSGTCEHIRSEYIHAIERSGCHFFVYRLQTVRKNALDFYIASEAGCILARGETHVGLVSRDKGFESIKDFLKIRSNNKINVAIAGNVENVLSALNDRKGRRSQILQDIQMLKLPNEYNRIMEKRQFHDKITNAFSGTDYETATPEILDFIEENRNSLPGTIYTGALHTFGRSAGIEIYRILKTVIQEETSNVKR